MKRRHETLLTKQQNKRCLQTTRRRTVTTFEAIIGQRSLENDRKRDRTCFYFSRFFRDEEEVDDGFRINASYLSCLPCFPREKEREREREREGEIIMAKNLHPPFTVDDDQQ
jgi:hypothetical protein